MWSKFFRIPALLLLLVVTYYGCVEEPTIDPVKRPYTLLRVANFSYNVDTVMVSIDNGAVINLYKNQLPSQYFEIQSGKRNFLVKNSAGVILYNDKISIGSYEEITLSFTGYSKPGDDFLNTFGFAQYTNGVVYLFEGMGKDTTVIQCANFAPDTPTDSSIKYTVLFTDTTAKKVVKEVASLSYNSYAGAALPGNKTYKINFAKLTSRPTDVVKKYDYYGDTTYTFDTGYQYFVYGVGDPKKPYFVVEKNSPLAIRSK